MAAKGSNGGRSSIIMIGNGSASGTAAQLRRQRWTGVTGSTGTDGGGTSSSTTATAPAAGRTATAAPAPRQHRRQQLEDTSKASIVVFFIPAPNKAGDGGNGCGTLAARVVLECKGGVIENRHNLFGRGVGAGFADAPGVGDAPVATGARGWRATGARLVVLGSTTAPIYGGGTGFSAVLAGGWRRRGPVSAVQVANGSAVWVAYGAGGQYGTGVTHRRLVA